MIKMRLVRLLQGAGKNIIYQIIWQTAVLIAQIVIVQALANFIAAIRQEELLGQQIAVTLITILIGSSICFFGHRLYSRAGYRATRDVKRLLRQKIYEKVLRLGPSYKEQSKSIAIVQMAGEGVEQLETYFGQYLSQFFYALIAPLILFAYLSFTVSVKVALTLYVTVWLIPPVIMIVMIVAKKLLSKYFKSYYNLGGNFLEKLRGMTTLKIYQADEAAAASMDEEAENFRKITMKVLLMQLNSISVMDAITYVGACGGIIVALHLFAAGTISLAEAIVVLFLALEFFLPMRALGSLFHIGMNGIKAADRIFAFLDLPEPTTGEKELMADRIAIELQHLTFAYEPSRTILQDVNIAIAPGSFISLVGVSGSGKSTIASLIMGKHRTYNGQIKFNGTELSDYTCHSIMDNITLVGSNSWIFQGTVRDNLLQGKATATVAEMEKVLEEVNLLNFVRERGGLDMPVMTNGSNLSGGQKQRLALARALLHDTPVYIFDEATSNVDVESETLIMQVIHQLAARKTILFISHKLANVAGSDKIYLLQNGKVAEAGTQAELMELQGTYYKLFTEQKRLLRFSTTKEGEQA